MYAKTACFFDENTEGFNILLNPVIQLCGKMLNYNKNIKIIGERFLSKTRIKKNHIKSTAYKVLEIIE